MDAPDIRNPLGGDETRVGSFAGGGVNADVVFEIDPGSEGGVEFVEGGEPGALGFGLEIIFDDLVDRFNFAFTVRLVGLVVEFGRCELRENPCKLLGDIDRTVIQVDFTRYAPAKDEALECVLHAGELFVEVVAAGKDLARVVVDPDEEVGLFRACYRGEPDSVACVALDEVERTGRLEAMEGHAAVIGETVVALGVGHAVFAEKAVDRTVRDERDARCESGIGSQ